MPTMVGATEVTLMIKHFPSPPHLHTVTQRNIKRGGTEGGYLSSKHSLTYSIMPSRRLTPLPCHNFRNVSRKHSPAPVCPNLFQVHCQKSSTPPSVNKHTEGYNNRRRKGMTRHLFCTSPCLATLTQQAEEGYRKQPAHFGMSQNTLRAPRINLTSLHYH